MIKSQYETVLSNLMKDQSVVHQILHIIKVNNIVL